QIKGILGVDYVLGFNSGRSAIEVALRALPLNQGDEVIVPSFCCLAAVLPIIRAGCIPVFADVDETLNIDPEKIPDLISAKTRALSAPSQGDFHTLSRLIRFVMLRRLRKATLPFYAAYEHLSTRFSPPKDSDDYEIRQIANVDAALGLVQLSKLDELIEKRAR